MTAAMPQPEKMTASDVEGIAVFLLDEASKLALVGQSVAARSFLDTASVLTAKARRMRES